MTGLGLRKSTWEKFQARFGVEEIYELYGMTEGAAGFLNIDGVPGMIGRLTSPNIELARIDIETGEFLRDENGSCIRCKPGEIGMCLQKITEDSIFTGYKNKEKTKQKLLHDVFEKGDEYFISGDILKLHDDWWVSFADRFGDTYRWHGENVSTLEVENILNSNSSVSTSAVYGVAIPKAEGNAGMATIKLQESIKFEPEEFSRFIIEVLPGYSIPVFIRIRDELEFTGPYKIKKVTLKKESYNIDIIKDEMYFWDSSNKKYCPLDDELYKKIINGKIRI
jgi:acyl-CoA synthetase (AMP-forming)/AMP-acid ligase II